MDKKVKIFAGLLGGLAILLIGAGCGPTAPDTSLPDIPTLTTDTSAPVNSETIELTGKKEAGTAIWINGVRVIDFNDSEDWSYNLILREGNNPIYIIAEGKSGKLSGPYIPTPNILYILPASAFPQAPALNAITSPTNQATQTISGTKPSGTSIWINGKRVVEAGDSTDWSYVVALVEGNNFLMISAVDKVGNSSDSITANILLKSLPPITPVMDPVDPIISASTVILSGIKEAGSAVWLIASPAQQIIPANDNTTWTYTFTFGSGAGEYNLRIYSIDEAGNKSGETQLALSFDPTPPNATVVNAVVTPTNQASQVLSGMKDANTSILINGVEQVTLNGSTTWVCGVNLLEGSNAFSITSKDAAGNTSTATSVTIIRDTTAPLGPVLTAVTSPAKLATQDISGTKEANTSIRLNGTEIVALSAETAWTYQNLALIEGNNSLLLTARDAAGNESPVTAGLIVLDTAKPSSPGLSPVLTPTYLTPQRISGTKEANTSVRLTTGPYAGQIVAPNPDTTWSYDLALSTGSNAISLITRDAAGNDSDVTTSSITFDNGTPANPTVNAVVSPTNVNSQVLSGTKAAGSSILINSVERIPANSETTWAYTISLSSGPNTFTITSKSAAGKPSSGSASASITVDTIPPPSAPSLLYPSNGAITTTTLFGWAAATDNPGGVGVDAYNFQAALNGNFSVPLEDAVIGSTWYLWYLSDDTYSWRVRARDAAGNYGPWSETRYVQFQVQSQLPPGDFNMDHISDLIIGSPGYGASKGRVYIYHGHASAPWLYDPIGNPFSPNADGFGFSTAIAGDIDGDNRADALVGAPDGKVGAIYPGYAYVLSGRGLNDMDHLWDAGNSWLLTGSADGEHFGFSVAGADVNGDGFADVIVGAPAWNSNQGRIFIYLGGSGFSMNSTPDQTITGELDSSFGFSVASAGDFNNDGIEDIIVGAPDFGAVNYDGKAYIIFGKQTVSQMGWGSGNGLQLQLPPSYRNQYGDGYDNFGYSVSGGGDYNYDGIPDVIVGAPFADPGKAQDLGMTEVFYGPNAVTWTVLDERRCPGMDLTSDDEFGTSVADLGPTYGLAAGPTDFIGDIVVGSPYAGPSSGFYPGGAVVYMGSAQGIKSNCASVFWGVNLWDRFGENVSPAGDLDGDGWNDFLVYASGRDGALPNIGEVQVVYSGGVTTFVNEEMYQQGWSNTGNKFGLGLGGKAN